MQAVAIVAFDLIDGIIIAQSDAWIGLSVASRRETGRKPSTSDRNRNRVVLPLLVAIRRVGAVDRVDEF